MFHLELTLPTPEQNLACDEALLDLCESGGAEEILRFWEPAQYFVVVGYANEIAREVNMAFCRQQGIPVLRRCTGGGTILQGPGCLNYSLLLQLDGAHPLSSISATNEFVMARHRDALGALLRAPVEHQGHTDLAIGGLKFSGNSQRRRKRFLLFHGCFLLHLDIGMVEKTLRAPSREPVYRVNRSHSDFLMNIKLPSAELKAQLCKSWNTKGPFSDFPAAEIDLLARNKYSQEDWNLKRR